MQWKWTLVMSDSVEWRCSFVSECLPFCIGFVLFVVFERPAWILCHGRMWQRLDLPQPSTGGKCEPARCCWPAAGKTNEPHFSSAQYPRWFGRHEAAHKRSKATKANVASATKETCTTHVHKWFPWSSNEHNWRDVCTRSKFCLAAVRKIWSDYDPQLIIAVHLRRSGCDSESVQTQKLNKLLALHITESAVVFTSWIACHSQTLKSVSVSCVYFSPSFTFSWCSDGETKNAPEDSRVPRQCRQKKKENFTCWATETLLWKDLMLPQNA